jgi:hypothetical protein
MSGNQLSLFDSLDLTNANEVVLVANTPAFLLDRLRKDSSVAHIAQTVSTSAILGELSLLSAAPPQRVQDVVRRYVYLAALALKDPGEIWPGLAEIDLSGVQWGDQLRAMIEAQTVATSRIVAGLPTAEVNANITGIRATNARTIQVVQQDPGRGRIIR